MLRKARICMDVYLSASTAPAKRKGVEVMARHIGPLRHALVHVARAAKATLDLLERIGDKTRATAIDYSALRVEAQRQARYRASIAPRRRR